MGLGSVTVVYGHKRILLRTLLLNISQMGGIRGGEFTIFISQKSSSLLISHYLTMDSNASSNDSRAKLVLFVL